MEILYHVIVGDENVFVFFNENLLVVSSTFCLCIVKAEIHKATLICCGDFGHNLQVTAFTKVLWFLMRGKSDKWSFITKKCDH